MLEGTSPEEHLRNRPEDRAQEASAKLMAELQSMLQALESESSLRKKAEEGQRESVRRYRSLVEQSPDAIILHRAGTMEYLNPAAVRLFGAKKAGDLIGTSILERIHPDHRSLVQSRMNRLLQGKRIPRKELKLVDIHGREVDVEATGALVGPGGAIQTILRDVSRRKRADEALRKSEARYRELVELLHEGVVIVDPEEIITFANPRMAEMCGCPLRDLIGRSFLSLADAENAEAVRKSLGRRKRGMQGRCEVSLRRQDGSRLYVSLQASPMTDGRGRHAGSLVTLVDMSERKRAEERLRVYAENLKRSNEDLERFAYVSSHDLQEPLRTIVSFTQLLERRYKGQMGREADEYIDYIVDAGKRMQALINDLLEYSRVTTRGGEITESDSEMALEQAISNLRSQLEASGTAVTHDPLPAVLADPPQLVQVFQNLISNAVKYRREDEPPKVHVSAERRNGYVQFSVADNGIGIEPQYFDRIFVIFQRLHGREKYSGTGIGLAVVKRIVERHGGAIRVESEPGKGATFFFTLPEPLRTEPVQNYEAG